MLYISFDILDHSFLTMYHYENSYEMLDSQISIILSTIQSTTTEMSSCQRNFCNWLHQQMTKCQNFKGTTLIEFLYDPGYICIQFR